MSIGGPTTVATDSCIAGLHASTLDAVCQAIGTVCPGEPRQWVVSDISLGAWRSHQVATEFCAQLAITAPRPPLAAAPTPSAHSRQLSYADLISHGIDTEALGDTATLIAAKAVTGILAAAQPGPSRTFLVFAPRHGFHWEPEDLLFVRLLAPRLKSIGSRLIVVYSDSSELPAGLSLEWLNEQQPVPPPRAGGQLLGLVPGTVEPEVAQALQAAERNGATPMTMLPLAQGHMLIAPECRGLPGTLPRLEFDRLAAASRDCDWLRAYAEFYGNNTFVEPGFLLAQAWRRFSEGASGLALRLLARASACCATPLERATAACQMQGMRIALRLFDDAARGPDPPGSAPVPLRSFLLQAKGYGLAMSGQPEAAMACLSAARGLREHESIDREYLYLLNISALASLKMGDPHAALAMERDIEARAASLPVPDWRLRYIAAINIARVSRRLGDLEAARRSYDVAFSTCLGMRSESEAVYANVCTARLDAERGHRLQAFQAWLRASLHWISAGTPEALGTRVANSLVKSIPATPDGLVEEVSKALLSALARSAAECGQAVVARAVANDLDTQPPIFARTDCLADPVLPDCAIGGSGWGVLGARRRLACNVAGIETPGRQRLRSLVWRLLTSLSGAAELRDIQTVVVDDRLGQEVPVTAFELIENAVRLRVPRIYFEDTGLTLTESSRACLEAQARIGLGKAVARLDQGAASAAVVFKRRLPDATVSKEIGLLLNELNDKPSLTELSTRLRSNADPEQVLRQLRTLEASRIVYLSFPEESCTAAGISWRSKAN